MKEKSVSQILTEIRTLVNLVLFDVFSDDFDGADLVHFSRKYSGRCKNCGGQNGKDYEMHFTSKSTSILIGYYEDLFSKTDLTVFDDEDSDILCSAFRPYKKFEAYRGCHTAKLYFDLNNEALIHISDKLKKIGIKVPRSDRLRNLENYPPDESIFSIDDDRVFCNLLEAIAKSRSQEALKIIDFFSDDDEMFIAKHASKLKGIYF